MSTKDIPLYYHNTVLTLLCVKYYINIAHISMIIAHNYIIMGFPGDTSGKEPAFGTGDVGSISGLGRSSGEGNGNPFQYSCLENLMDSGAWWATVHSIAQSQHD